MAQKRRISALILTVFAFGLLTPTATAACSLNALDTVAGLGTQVSAVGCESGSATLRVLGPAGMEYTQSIALDAQGNATTLIPSKYTLTAGTYQVTLGETKTQFDVFADRADDGQSTLVASPKSIRADGKDAATVTAVLRDKYDNPVSGRPIALMSSRGSDNVESLSGETDDDGRIVWRVTGTEHGVMTLIPYDIISSKQLKLRADVSVGTASVASRLTAFVGGDDDLSAELSSTEADHFELELPDGETDVQANELFGMTIRAMRGTQLVRGYVGTLIVESTDPDAELPKKGEDSRAPDTGRIDMRTVDQGERTLSLIFLLRETGPQTIRVYDKADPSIEGEIVLNVRRGGAGADDEIVILDPPDRSRIGDHSVLLQGRAPSLVNLIVKGGLRTVETESDEEGVFRVNVELNPEDKEATLFVQSENGTYESAPLHLIVDTDTPVIQSISFTPETGKAGAPAGITVKAETDLETVTATVDGTETQLTETGAGLYIGTIMAPDEAGTYDVTVHGTDPAGNKASMLTKWTVQPAEMPVVTGVVAGSRHMQVELSWDEVDTMPVAAYKIYIADAEDPQNYLYSLSTGKPVTSAVITDLPGGRTYQFSLTAIGPEGEESPEKSEPATAAPLGMQLKATSGDASLFLEWSKPADITLDHYILEYGTEPGNYPEKRTINGSASSYMLRDLIDGVTYELRLTPIAVNGQTMADLASTVRGTPGGDGFSPGAHEPAPPGILDDLHPGASFPPLDHVPSTTGSGISTVLLTVTLLAAGAGTLLWRHQRRQHLLVQEFLSDMHRRYRS